MEMENGKMEMENEGKRKECGKYRFRTFLSPLFLKN